MLLVVGCSNARDVSPTAGEATTTTVDAGASVDGASTGALPNDAAVDAPSVAICVEGRRRCMGHDLEICDEGAWVVLESCLDGESCDVAVGVCRAADAGSDAE